MSEVFPRECVLARKIMLNFFKVILNHFSLKFGLSGVHSFLVTELLIFQLDLDIYLFKGCNGKFDLFE